MLTLFATPKPFKDRHTALIQRNAITSWTLLRPRPEILLFGDDSDTPRICEQLSLRYVPGVLCNEFGTPLLNDMFEKAQSVASFHLMAYVNADIILMNDFLDAVQKVSQSKSKFLMFGQRWDIDLDESWDFETPDWEKRLREYAIQSRHNGQPWGLADYFVFAKGIWKEIPRFAIGRTTFDNWLIYGARALDIPVVDATEVVMAIHQKHDYRHQPHQPNGWDGISKGVEARRNRALSGGEQYNQFGLYDATHLLTAEGLRRALSMKYLIRSLDRAAVLHPRLIPLRWASRFKEVLARGFAKVSGSWREC